MVQEKNTVMPMHEYITGETGLIRHIFFFDNEHSYLKTKNSTLLVFSVANRCSSFVLTSKPYTVRVLYDAY